jgi:hypothetical protein
MKDTSPIALDSQMIAQRPGKIEGAFYREYNVSENAWQNIAFTMSDVSFLRPGQTLSVEAGKAYVVKTGESSWLLANFHQCGQMTGPLIYAEVEAERPTETLKKSEASKRNSIEIPGSLFLATFIITLIGILVFSFFSWDSSPTLGGIHVFPVLFILGMSLSCYRELALLSSYIEYHFFSRKDDQAALRMLQIVEGTKPKIVPLSDFDALLLKQSISKA